MAEDQGKEEEKFDFTPEGEGLLTLGDARMLAVRTAAESPGDYGNTYQAVAMVFEVAESGEDADYYTVTLSVRPQGNFIGTAGQEQFLIRQDGTIAVRQVLSLPTKTSASPADTASKRGGFPILPVAIGVVIIGVIAAVGAMFLISSSGGDSVLVAAVAPTETPVGTDTQLSVLAARDFEVVQFDGETFRLSQETESRAVVLNFWYPSCRPCREEMPAFEAAWQELKDEPVRFLGLYVPQGIDSELDARDFINELGLTFSFATDRLARIAEAYELEYFPTTFVIDKTGDVVATHISNLKTEEIIQQVRALVGESDS